MIHILYETVNLINGKKYIGIHSTNDEDDGYLGSGSALKDSINKYGKENFSRKIIKTFDSRKELIEAEKDLVDHSVVNSDQYYNISLGGMSYIDSLIDIDKHDLFIEHQSKAGQRGGPAYLNSLSDEDRKEWHSKGGKASKNLGGYSMSDQGKTNIKNARKNSQKYKCPFCDSKPLDGGNFNKHLISKHGVEKEACYQWRAGAKVDN